MHKTCACVHRHRPSSREPTYEYEMSKEGTRPARGPHRWEFKARFRGRAFGWRSQPAIQRVKEAVNEIRKVARRDPILGAEGAVLFLERVSGALEQVDSSSGAIGTAVNRAIEELVPIIAGAPAGTGTRQQWLDRLFQAHADDGIPYIELLADHWGELCASSEIASAWADELIGIGPGEAYGEYRLCARCGHERRHAGFKASHPVFVQPHVRIWTSILVEYGRGLA